MARDSKKHIKLAIQLAYAAHDFAEASNALSSRLAAGQLTDSHEDSMLINDYGRRLDALINTDAPFSAYLKEHNDA